MSIELRLDDDNQIVCDWGVITDWAPIGCSTTEQIRHLWMLRTDWIAHALFYGKPFLTPLGVIEVTATSSASWSERRNWLHQPKGITADHWNYLRLWADCGHGVGTDRLLCGAVQARRPEPGEWTLIAT